MKNQKYKSWYIAIEFYDVDFYGFQSEEMKQKWADIKYERYVEYDSIFNQNEIQIKDWRNVASAIRNQVRRAKPFYHFGYNKTEKDLLQQISFQVK